MGTDLSRSLVSAMGLTGQEAMQEDWLSGTELGLLSVARQLAKKTQRRAAMVSKPLC